jgi:hypothetical protein
MLFFFQVLLNDVFYYSRQPINSSPFTLTYVFSFINILTTKHKTNKRIFISGFPNILYGFVNYFARSSYTTEPITLNLFTLSIFGEDYKFWSSSLCIFHPCLLPLSYVQIRLPRNCSQITSVCVASWWRETKFTPI